MSSLLAKLKAGTKNSREINFPGSETKIKLVLLSEQDTLDAIIAADNVFKGTDTKVDFHTVNAFENEKSTQMLYRACCDIENKSPIADNVSEFRRLITNEDRAVLIKEYNSLVEECNPSPVDMSAEEFDILVETVKKNPEATIGNISSLSILKRLSLFLAEALQNSQKDNGHTSL